MTTGTNRHAVAPLRRVKATTLLLMSSMALIAGCVTATVLTPSQSDVNRVQNKFPGYTLADLHRGQSLYEANCKRCHALQDPASKTEAQWNVIVPAMVKKVNKNSTVLDQQAEEDIRRYVITMGSAPAR
jgi:cytochrome c5